MGENFAKDTQTLACMCVQQNSLVLLLLLPSWPSLPIVVYSLGRIAVTEAGRRGWWSYTDLAALWEGSDMPQMMMDAGKQTAKVKTLFPLTQY